MLNSYYLVTIFLTVALVFQIFATVSAPIVKTIAISEYNGYRFGVFGWCKNGTITCSSVKVGYSLDTPEVFNETGNPLFPSYAKKSLSKLLLAHSIALGATAILWILGLVLHLKDLKHHRHYLLVFALLCMATFLISLLSFLVDLVLFVSFLLWPSWLVLVSTILLALTGTMLWALRRSAALRHSRLQNEDELMFHMVSLCGEGDSKKKDPVLTSQERI